MKIRQIRGTWFCTKINSIETIQELSVLSTKSFFIPSVPWVWHDIILSAKTYYTESSLYDWLNSRAWLMYSWFFSRKQNIWPARPKSWHKRSNMSVSLLKQQISLPPIPLFLVWENNSVKKSGVARVDVSRSPYIITLYYGLYIWGAASCYRCHKPENNED